MRSPAKTNRRLLILFLLALSVSVGAAAETAGRPDGQAQARAMQSMAAELTGSKGDATPEQRVVRGERINSAFVALTGEAINPLFGITAAGIYRYWRTAPADRDGLPLYEQPVVWVPLLAIILLMAFNSTICSVVPFMNAPLNILGNITNAAGAAVVMPLVLGMFADSFAGPAGSALAQAYDFVVPAAHAAEAPAGTSFWLSLGWMASCVIGLFSYIAVWLTAYTVDVLVLLSPWSVIDAILKSARLAVMGLLALLNQISPGVAVMVAAVIVAFSACFSFVAFKYFVRAWRFIYRKLFGAPPVAAVAAAAVAAVVEGGGDGVVQAESRNNG